MSRTVTQRLTFNLLGYLGLLPFALSAVMSLVGTSPIGADPRFLFTSYSAIILSFLGGVLWGRCLGQSVARASRIVLLLSNCFALMAWSGLLLGDTAYKPTLLVLMLGYLLVYLAERRHIDADATDLIRYYMKMRLVLTSLVISTHLLLLIAG